MHSKLFGERAWQITLKSSKEQQRNLWYLLAPNLKLTLQKGIVSSVVLISPLQQLCTVVFINVGVCINVDLVSPDIPAINSGTLNTSLDPVYCYR